MTIQSKGNEPQVTINEKEDSFTYNTNLMVEGMMYDFIYKGTKMSVKKEGKNVRIFSE